MLGWECDSSALRVGTGTESFFTNRTGSPERAAQAAAGIAQDDCSPETTSTSGVGPPATPLSNLSTPWAIVYGSLPWIAPLLTPPPGAGGRSPTRIALIPCASGWPVGFRRPMAELVAPGNESPSLRRMGAWSGGPVGTAGGGPARPRPSLASGAGFRPAAGGAGGGTGGGGAGGRGRGGRSGGA